jgi:hypothetical protein
MDETKNSVSSYAIHTGYGLVSRSEKRAGFKEFYGITTSYALASITIALVIFYMLV